MNMLQSNSKTVKSLVSFLGQKVFTLGLISGAKGLQAALIGVILCSFFGTALGQEAGPSSPQKGSSNPGVYASSEIDTVNMVNGNLMVNIPLASLPKGRGGHSNGLALTYNSKLYETTMEELSTGSGTICRQRMLRGTNEAGWNYTNRANYSLKLESRINTEGWNQTQTPYEYGKNAFIWKLFILTPDGARHEMRPAGYSDYYGDGYFNISANGWLFQAGCSTLGGGYSCTVGQTLATTAPMVYYSTDGSYMKLVVDHDTNPANQDGGNNNWTLYMADGTRVVKNQGIFDRNGNRIPGLVDEFGRAITLTPNTSTNEDTVQYQGPLGPVSVVVKWKTITVSQNYRTDGYSGGRGRNCTSTQFFTRQWRVVDEVRLPVALGGLKYQFRYDVEVSPTGQGWGELAEITMPSGAKIQYTYTPYATGTLALGVDQILARSVQSKTVTYNSEYDGVVTPVSDTWTYDITTGFSSLAAPDGGITLQAYGDTSYQHRLNGVVTMITGPDGTKVERLIAWNYPTGANQSANVNQYLKTEFRTVTDAAGNLSLTAIKDFSYDKNGNPTRIAEYDFVPYASLPKDQQGAITGFPANLTPTRVTVNEYWAPTPDATITSTNDPNCYWLASSPNVRNALKSTELRTGAGVPVSRTEMTYDNPFTTANVTQFRTWDSSKPNSTFTVPLIPANSNLVQTQFDQFGNPTLITDARGVQTQIEYGPIGPNGIVGLYPTGQRAAFQTALQRYSTTGYQFETGLAIWSRDEDNNVLSTVGYDAVGRVIEQVAAVNTPTPSKTVTEYHDVARREVVRTNIDSFGDNRSVSVVHYDQLGRERLKRTLENPFDDVSNETLGIKVQTRYTFDSGTPRNGTYQVVSNPYRAATSAQATAEAMGWSVSYSDKTGRMIWAKTYSGTAVPALSPAGSTVNLTGTVSTAYDVSTSGTIGQVTTVTDQSGKVRRSITDAFGRLGRVDEPNASNQLGTVAAPNQATSYTYDIRDNLLQVNQGVQTRSFVYDSLSRLTSATAPESGTTSYTYDAGGNLVTKTDARGVVVTNTYDALNRPTQRSYALTANVGATSTANYYYDGAGLTGITPNFVKGKLTKVTNGSASYEYRDFDALGRVLSARQIIDGNNYDTSYSYNLAGALITETYPTGRTVTNTYNANGSLNAVSGRAAGQAVRGYASNFEYAAHGAATKFQYGSGLWEETAFNSRLQVTGLTLRKQANTLWNAAYDYGTTDNNGNVKSQSILHPGITQPLVQTYGYDSLNRLTQAIENHNSIEQWKQTFTYDRYGNRTVVTGQTTPSMVGPNPVINPANNRITPQVGEGYAFDTAGNMTFDKDGRKFVFDGENKVVTFFGNPGAPTTVTAEYRYDADGKRVKKVVGNVTTLFVYDAMGKMIAEYAINAPQPEPRTQFLTADMLSSQRVISDGQGTVTSRRDFAPFGEELPGNTTNRQASQGYASATDKTKQKFATYERDDESGLDFAKVRHLNFSYGRFFSPDPIIISQTLFEPQLWNRYSYVLNNPLSYIDENGKWPTWIHDFIIDTAFPGLTPYERQQIKDGSFYTDFPTTLFPIYANHHGMAVPGQTDQQAIKSWSAIMSQNLSDARELQNIANGQRPDINGEYSPNYHARSLYCFGRATHNMTDSLSPCHGFNTFYGPPDFTFHSNPGISFLGIALYYIEQAEHVRGESEITSEQLQKNVQQIQKMYKSVYGEDSYFKATGKRNPNQASTGQGSFGLIGPSVDRARKDLGVVLVTPNGIQTYYGPLKPNGGNRRSN